MNEQTKKGLRLQATQYADAHLPIVSDFIRELNAVDITYFCYIKSVQNTSFMRFCQKNDWIKQTFGGLMDPFIVDGFFNKIKGGNKITLWQSCFIDSPVTIVMEEFRKMNINNGITLLKSNERGVCEFFNFASTNDNPQILDFYLNHLDFLEDTSNRFSQRMGKALDHTIPGRLEPLDSPVGGVLPQHLYPQKGVVISSFYGKDPVETLEVFLTEKQFACFDLLKKGYPTKQIAQILGKSPRTIDSHIAVVFDKFGIMTRHALIDLPVVIRHVG